MPHFETYDDANDWIERRAKDLGMSRRAFSSTDEYKAIYPQIEALYQDQKAKTAEQRMAALRDAGLAVGDRVQTTVPGMFLDGTDYSGTIVLRGGEPWVKVDGKITVSKKGRLREASTVRWDSRWKKQTATAGAPAAAQQSMEAQDGLQEGRQEAQVSEPVQVDGGWALEEVPQHEKPLAGDGLTSYRYRGPYGYVMIGARDHQDALNEARRSLTEGDATIDNLQVWDGNQYVDVTGPESGEAVMEWSNSPPARKPADV